MLVPLVLVLYIVGTDWLIRRLPEAYHARVRPWFWVGPALLLVTGFLIYPGIATAWISLLTNDGRSFVGLANFGQVLSDNSVLIAIRNNILWLVFYTAFVLAFSCAYAVTKDRHYLRRMHEAFAWFLGSNRLGVPLYDFSTGGCHDGIGLSHVNRNQGAESTVCFLMALLEMLEVDAGKLEHPAAHRVTASANAANPN